jgi:hypothetical protein
MGVDMQQTKQMAKAGKRMGKKVMATDTAQDAVAVVVDGLEEVAVDKADDVAEGIKSRAAQAGGRSPKRASGTTNARTKKSTAKKSTARKSTARNSTARKSTARKSMAKRAGAKKSAARKSTARKSMAKRAGAKKSAARKSTAKKPRAKRR